MWLKHEQRMVSSEAGACYRLVSVALASTLVVTGLCGCRSVFYLREVSPENARPPGGAPGCPALCVLPAEDRRVATRDNKVAGQILGNVFYLLWWRFESAPAGKSPRDRDLIGLQRSVANHLRASGSFRQVDIAESTGIDRSDYDLCVQPDLLELNAKGVLWFALTPGATWTMELIGLPYGKEHVKYAFRVKALEPLSRKTVWSKDYRDQTPARLQGLYYGHDLADDVNESIEKHYATLQRIDALTLAAKKPEAERLKREWFAHNVGEPHPPRPPSNGVGPESPPATVAAVSPGDGLWPPDVKVTDSASVGLAIGVSEYVHFGKIGVCGSDAKRVAAAICRARGINPKHVAVMTDDSRPSLRPTKETIRERVKLCGDEARADGLVFVYFSGHGVMQGKELCLVPSDCRAESAISVSQVVQALERSKAKDKLLIIDACHASAEQKGAGGIQPSLVKQQRSVAVLLSCGEGEFSYLAGDGKHSAYTECLVKALEELAGFKSAVTARGLHARTEELMREWRLQEGKKQTPKMIQPSDGDVVVIPGKE